MSGALTSALAPRAGRLRRSVIAVVARPAGWAVLGVVLVVALAIGSVHPSAPTKAARIAGLEDVIKCPSCVDLSIRQSDAAAAIDLRTEVVRLVDQGRTDAAIERLVVAQYGSAELLAPPTSGFGALVWVVPVGVLALSGVALGWSLVAGRRREDPEGLGPSAEDEAIVEAALGRGPDR